MYLSVILNNKLQYRLIHNEASEDYILSSIEKYNNWEPNVTRKFLLILEKASEYNTTGLVLDVGACFGYYSILAAKLGFKTYAFEPNPKTAELLEKNVSLNQLNHLVKIQKNALGSTTRKQTLSVPEKNFGAGNFFGSGEVNYEIEVNVLDDFELPEKILIFKIDVEGHEPDVLKGSLNTILELKAEFIFLEISPKFNAIKEIINTIFIPLWKAEYQSFDIGLQDTGVLSEAIEVFQLFDKEHLLTEYLLNKGQTNFIFIRRNGDNETLDAHSFKQDIITTWTNDYIQKLLKDTIQDHKMIGELKLLIETLKKENHKLFEDLKNAAEFQKELLEVINHNPKN
ncbi:FkbM family methyltransferase [Lacibacter sediminis]|uniref:FkbM family methyltransferase n=1 Tax=Lacibacter sediminis TaxID=2760713 RepID=A0A7G5XED9_9BACT|nr:FkbM family methyltransferase [Lacibacter sediminis]QNA43842.1 FkbM family methyltransferase [Lacibacter sediminis]